MENNSEDIWTTFYQDYLLLLKMSSKKKSLLSMVLYKKQRKKKKNNKKTKISILTKPKKQKLQFLCSTYLFNNWKNCIILMSKKQSAYSVALSKNILMKMSNNKPANVFQILSSLSRLRIQLWQSLSPSTLWLP